MIDELNQTVKKIEALELSVPYLSLTIDRSGPTLQVSSDTFGKIGEEVDPILILKGERVVAGVIERSILIGTVRVFALYEE